MVPKAQVRVLGLVLEMPMIVGDRMKGGGFTLIELLVTISVIVVLATIAVPGFNSMVASNRLSADFNEALVGLRFARSESVKRRENISAHIVSQSPWRIEIRDSSGSSIRVLEGSDARVRASPEGFMVTFNPLGRRAVCGNQSSEGFIVTPNECQLEIFYRRASVMTVGLSGAISRL